ncbi:MAG TPA: hypothetical protein VES68_02140 [Candidatus Sulfotelmatobacter sp.]|nr:hypothetical protein [Candidatus Sulfotelmatobacter sp.]
MIKKFYFFLFLGIVYLALYIASANAQTMSNSNYIIQMGNLNSFSGKGTGSSYTLTSTGGQSGAFLFTGSNYKVKLGFQYIYPFTFRFSISTVLIDFGIITPGTPITRKNRLTVSNFSAHGYQVTVSQNHNLRVNASGREIPATTCDAGTCTPTTAAAWTSSLVYGFGYRCDNTTGTDCDSQFATSTFYKPFISSPSATVVMSSTNAGANRRVDITYKVNVPNTQAAGLYTSILNYIATPTF